MNEKKSAELNTKLEGIEGAKTQEDWEIDKEMDKRGIVNPIDLEETDTWVNSATRRDIRKILKKYNNKVFGLKFWSWEVVEGEKLKNVGTFEIDLIFRNEDKEKVFEKIKNEKDAYKLVLALFDMALYSCSWV
jgi:hypothetical protein